MATARVAASAVSAAAATMPSCSRPIRPIPADLAREQLAGRHGGEQDLHDPARLLLDHALGHLAAVEPERDPEQDRRPPGPTTSVLGQPRVCRLEGLDRDLRAAHRRREVSRGEPGRREARRRAPPARVRPGPAEEPSSSRRRWARSPTRSPARRVPGGDLRTAGSLVGDVADRDRLAQRGRRRTEGLLERSAICR